MGILADALRNTTQYDTAPVQDTLSDTFAKGLRSGVTGAQSQLAAVAGGVAEAMGADEFAQRRYLDMQRLSEQAQAEAPQLRDWRDVDGVGDALRYGLGMGAQSAPSLAAATAGALLTRGRVPLTRMAGATAAQVPLETGDVIQRQQQDAEQAQHSAGERLATAAAGGTASSVIGSVVPGAVAGKLMGRTAAEVGKKTATQILGRGAKDAAMEGVTEVGGEVAKQTAENVLDPTQGYNTNAMIDAGVGGVASGGMLAVPGTAAELTAAKGDQAKRLMGSGVDTATRLFGRGKSAATGALTGADAALKERGIDLGAQAGDAADTATKLAGWVRGKAKDTADAVADFGRNPDGSYDLGTAKADAKDALGAASDTVLETLRAAKTSASSKLESLAAGGQFLDPKRFEGKQGEDLKAAVAEDDNERIALAEKWGRDLIGKIADPAAQQKLTAALGDLGNKANQAYIAGLQKAQEGAAAARGAVGELRKLTSVLAPKAEGKKQADYAGVDKLVREAIAPYLAEHAPDVLNDSQATSELASALRELVPAMANGAALPMNGYMQLLSVTGDRTVDLLSKVAESSNLVEGAKAERFFDELNTLMDVQAGRRKLQQVLREAHPRGKEFSQREVDAVANGLVQWASTSRGDDKRSAFHDRRVIEGLREEFGDKADKVLEAAQALVRQHESRMAAESNENAGRSDADEFDPYGEVDFSDQLTERDRRHHTDVEGRRFNVFGVHPNENLSPGKTDAKGVSHAPAIEQAMAKVTARGKTARRIPATELGDDHPAVLDLKQRLFRQRAKELLAKVPEDLSDAERSLAEDDAVETAKQYAEEAVKEHDALVSEVPDSPLEVTQDELDGLRLNTKDHARSPSRVQVDDGSKHGMILDAVKMTEAMKARLKGEVSPGRESGARRDARMFAEAVAAVQDHLGKSFDVPDSTVINRGGLTWGEAKKLDPRTESDMADDTDTSLLVNLRRAYREATPSQKREIVKEANEIVGRKRKKQAAEQMVGEGRQEAEEDLGGRQEVDPFGPTHDALRGRDDRPIYTDGGEARVEGARAPSLLGGRRAATGKDLPAPKPKPRLKAPATDEEGTPDPKAVAAKKAAFLERARSGDKALVAEVSATTDAKGLWRALRAMVDAGIDSPVYHAAHARMAELVQDPDVAYALQLPKYSAQPVDPNAHGPRDLQPVFDYLKRVLDDSVEVMPNAAIPHAGEFVDAWQRKGGAKDLIRISVHALNPLSTAHHEAMHSFFSRLMRGKNVEVAAVLRRAASMPSATMQLRAKLKDSPEALAQLSDPEERIAYMYQFWAQGDFKLAQEPQTLFGKVVQFFRSVLGVWSNDERALHVLNYFHRGDFAKDMHMPGVVAEKLLAPGRNKAVEAFKGMAKPLADLGEKVLVAGHQRLRDTEVPALIELADRIKLNTTGQGADEGYLPAARQERARFMNRLAAVMHSLDADAANAVGEALRLGDVKHLSTALAEATPETRNRAREAFKDVRALLDDAYTYMKEAGVDVGDLGVGKDYFPRVWDTSRISQNPQAFLDMLDKYKASGQLKGDPKQLMRALVTTDGGELVANLLRPGMQHVKPRELAFISNADAAPFMRQNFYEVLNGYFTQAARRAEWTRRFGEQSEVIGQLMEEATKQGATDKDIETALDYVRAVDGTLGDQINPEWRRLQGNLIVYQNIRLLPLAIFSSIVDPVGIVVRGGTVNDAWTAFKRGVRGMAKNFKRDPELDEQEAVAQFLGTVDSVALSRTLGTSFNQGMVGDTARKINDTFFRFNLMEQYNTDMRVMATQAALGFLARHADGKKSAHSPRWLAELGLKPGELQLDAEGQVKFREDQGLTPEQAAKVRMAINRWVDGAVLRPDAADKPMWMSDPHFAIFAHLKQFIYAFHETILKRVAHEVKHGNMGPAYALASYVPVMIAADMAKGIIQGGGEEPAWKRDWTAGDYLWSGVQRAGLLGVGQFGVDVLQDVQRGGTGLGHLAGPTVEQLGDAVDVVAGRAQFSQFLLRGMPANALYAGGGKMEPAEEIHPPG